MCCKIPPIPELDKPENAWCRHCRPGKGGCTAYETRPDVCRKFACGWLMDDVLYGEEWKPSHSKIVIRCYDQGGGPMYQFMVDHSTPNRWREQFYYSTIKRVAFVGLNSGQYRTQVTTATQDFIILPKADIPFSSNQWVSFFNAGDPWDWWVETFDTLEQQQRYLEKINDERACRGLQRFPRGKASVH
jgi:hypothetical protein